MGAAAEAEGAGAGALVAVVPTQRRVRQVMGVPAQQHTAGSVPGQWEPHATGRSANLMSQMNG